MTTILINNNKMTQTATVKQEHNRLTYFIYKEKKSRLRLQTWRKRACCESRFARRRKYLAGSLPPSCAVKRAFLSPFACPYWRLYARQVFPPCVFPGSGPAAAARAAAFKPAPTLLCSNQFSLSCLPRKRTEYVRTCTYPPNYARRRLIGSREN